MQTPGNSSRKFPELIWHEYIWKCKDVLCTIFQICTKYAKYNNRQYILIGLSVFELKKKHHNVTRLLKLVEVKKQQYKWLEKHRYIHW